MQKNSFWDWLFGSKKNEQPEPVEMSTKEVAHFNGDFVDESGKVVTGDISGQSETGLQRAVDNVMDMHCTSWFPSNPEPETEEERSARLDALEAGERGGDVDEEPITSWNPSVDTEEPIPAAPAEHMRDPEIPHPFPPLPPIEAPVAHTDGWWHSDLLRQEEMDKKKVIYRNLHNAIYHLIVQYLFATALPGDIPGLMDYPEGKGSRPTLDGDRNEIMEFIWNVSARACNCLDGSGYYQTGGVLHQLILSPTLLSFVTGYPDKIDCEQFHFVHGASIPKLWYEKMLKIVGDLVKATYEAADRTRIVGSHLTATSANEIVNNWLLSENSSFVVTFYPHLVNFGVLPKQTEEDFRLDPTFRTPVYSKEDAEDVLHAGESNSAWVKWQRHCRWLQIAAEKREREMTGPSKWERMVSEALAHSLRAEDAANATETEVRRIGRKIDKIVKGEKKEPKKSGKKKTK
jgi:hypothetical protein